MVFSDHINNLGVSPLAGHQHLLKFPYIDMSQTYSHKMASTFTAAATQEGANVHQGVYMAFAGPQLQTPAEIRRARVIGADAVGMSTVLEATTAHALKSKVLGISVIKKAAPGRRQRKMGNQEPNKSGRSNNQVLISSIRRWLEEEAKSAF